MGHTRLGRLPQTMRWRQVIGLLNAPTLDEAAVARATTLAAERRLRQLANDPALVHASMLWLCAAMGVPWFGWRLVDDYLARRKTAALVVRHFVDRFVDESSPERTKRSCQDHEAWDTPLQARAAFLQLVAGLDL